MKAKKIIIKSIIFLLALYLVLLIPDSSPKAVLKPVTTPFEWNQDALWQKLENDFSNAKKQDRLIADSSIKTLFTAAEKLFATIKANDANLNDTVTQQLLSNYFQLAALTAAHPAKRDSFLNYYNAVRKTIKLQSLNSDINYITVRNNLYKLLYGMRSATEEVLLQTDNIAFSPILNVNNEPSPTPSANLFGIQVHSGDLLLSRGGAEVSALISRGNNYPGNFSHVALLYVDEEYGMPYLIEAHIEKGVAVSSAEQYIKDKKLRFMVLRPYADLPQLKADPMLPHKAALIAYNESKRRHIPYDFKMDFHDSTAMFCSEVGSYAYKKTGLELWKATSSISSKGVINWLSDFGVENFVTQMPSDLEYDPQLCVVAEWRDPETLLKDHIDNAVMDALLEQADKGEKIGYNIWQLPLVRLLKGWCIIKNLFGGIGMIPEGMSATRALKNQEFLAMYQKVKTETEVMANQFLKERGYRPPYWQLVTMAKKIAEKE